jgi:phage shock protein PspC (stress-responsive transcriptional regulator)
MPSASLDGQGRDMDNTTSAAGDQTVPPPPPPGTPAPGGEGFFDAMRRLGLVRTQERWIGGVAGGVARRLGIDPLLVRGILAVTVLLGGAGLVLYGLAWALLPEETDGRIHLQETIRGHFEIALLGAIALVVIGFNHGGPWFTVQSERGFAWMGGLLWLAAIAAVIAMVVAAANQRRARRAAGVLMTTPAMGTAPMGTSPMGTSPMGTPPKGTTPMGTPPTTTPATTTAWSAAEPPPGGSLTAQHPGYGVVPYAPPAGGAWSGRPGMPGEPAAPGGPNTPAGSTALRPAQPPLPLPPPPPRVPRTQGPGRAVVGAVVGLTLLALAALLVVDREGELGQPVLLTAIGIGVVLAGLGIVVSGLRGRSSGVLGFLAIVGLVLAVPAAVVPQFDGRFDFTDGDPFDDGFTVSNGDTWTPTTAAEARGGISGGFGDLDVDLTEVPLDGSAVEVPISMNAGDLRVVVPDDAAVTGDITLAAGEVTWAVDGVTRVARIAGSGAENFASEEAEDGAVDLAIRITAGAGEVRVVEED